MIIVAAFVVPEATNVLSEHFHEVVQNLVLKLRRAQDVAYCVDWEDYHEVEKKLIGDLEFPLGTEFPNEPLEDY